MGPSAITVAYRPHNREGTAYLPKVLHDPTIAANDERMTMQMPTWLHTEPPESLPSPLRGLPKTGGHDLLFVTGSRAMGWLAHHLRDETERTLWIDLDGARTVADAILLTGHQIGVVCPGRTSSVASALASLPIDHIVWDGRNVSPDVIHAAHSAVTALTNELHSWVSAEHASDFAAAVATPNAPEPIAVELPTELDVLAWLPTSRRFQISVPPALQRPDAQKGRLRVDVLNQLRKAPRRSIGSIADEVIHHHQDLFPIAIGASIGNVLPQELFGLRLIAEYASDENVACLAAAASSALRVRFGQPADALERIDQGLRRTSYADPAHRSLLVWAEARVHLSMGDLPSAEARFVDATSLAHAARDLALLATMHRRWADALSGHGEHERAAGHYRSARALYRQHAHPEGVSAALRGSADQAVALGETLSAEVLYDQAEMHTTTDVEHANRLLGWAGLAIAQADWRRAKTHLDRAARTAPNEPLIQANCLRRRADLALRSGDPITAIELANQALQLYALWGFSGSSARCRRLCGDAEAIQGAYNSVMRHYREAIQEHMQGGDIRGAERTVEHITGLLRSQNLGEEATIVEGIMNGYRRDAR